MYTARANGLRVRPGEVGPALVEGITPERSAHAQRPNKREGMQAVQRRAVGSRSQSTVYRMVIKSPVYCVPNSPHSRVPPSRVPGVHVLPHLCVFIALWPRYRRLVVMTSIISRRSHFFLFVVS